jgi:protein involved in ribonucleotide reduction
MLIFFSYFGNSFQYITKLLYEILKEQIRIKVYTKNERIEINEAL